MKHGSPPDGLNISNKIASPHLPPLDAVPPFWGDIIRHNPELLTEIPPEAIVLDWDYSSDLSHSEVLKIADASPLSDAAIGPPPSWNRGIVSP